VQSGAAHHIVHRKGSALLDTVDAFVLRPMILVQPADILHGADAPYIQQKQSNTDHTLNNRHQGAVADKALKQRGNEIRQYDKDAYCQHNRDHRHNTGQQLFSVATAHLVHRLIEFRFFAFLFFIEGSGIIQCSGSQDQGIQKIKDTTDKGKLLELTSVSQTLIGLHFHFNLAVRLADRYRILLFIFHHNAFQHGLSADTGITTLSSSHKTSSL